MTLLFMDGFDSRDTTIRWASNLGTTPVYTDAPQHGIGSTFRAGSSSGRVTKTITASTKVTMGFRFRVSSLASAVTMVSFFADTGTRQHHVLAVSTDGRLVAQRAATMLAQTAASTIAINTWYYVEMSGTIHDSTGTFEIRLNGATVVNFTGDTKNLGTNSTIDMVALAGATLTNPLVTWDDLYILNDSGSVNNTFLGDVIVEGIFPSAAGASTAMTPTGAANWENVDEVPWSTADYNTGTSGQRDSYTMSDLLTPAPVVHAAQTSWIGVQAVSSSSGKGVVRSGGTDYYDATSGVSTFETRYGAVWESDPATAAAWTASGVNSVEVGVEGVANTVRVYAVTLDVIYTVSTPSFLTGSWGIPIL